MVLLSFLVADCGNSSDSKKNTGSQVLDQSGNGTGDIVFKEYEHDFGKVVEGEKIAFNFTFENNGDADLVLTSATTSCGCTVPKYDTKPIPPGGTGNLEVVFDSSGRNGMQTKTIAVKSNASTPIVLLKITAEVITTLN